VPGQRYCGLPAYQGAVGLEDTGVKRAETDRGDGEGSSGDTVHFRNKCSRTSQPAGQGAVWLDRTDAPITHTDHLLNWGAAGHPPAQHALDRVGAGLGTMGQSEAQNGQS